MLDVPIKCFHDLNRYFQLFVFLTLWRKWLYIFINIMVLNPVYTLEPLGNLKNFSAPGFIPSQFICPALNSVTSVCLILILDIWGWIWQLKSSQIICIWETGCPYLTEKLIWKSLSSHHSMCPSPDLISFHFLISWMLSPFLWKILALVLCFLRDSTAEELRQP